MKKLYIKAREFLQSVMGQKFLILLAPFTHLPGETQSSNLQIQSFADQLYIKSGAPVMGSMFFASALAVLSRTLQRENLAWAQHLNFDSFTIWLYISVVLTVLSYTWVISKYLSPRLLNTVIKEAGFPSYSFGFWSTYYGGLLMFFGTFLWGFTLLFIFKLTFWLWLVLFVGLAVALWFLQRRLYFRRQEFLKDLSTLERLHLKTLETMMTIIQMGICIFAAWRFHL